MAGSTLLTHRFVLLTLLIVALTMVSSCNENAKTDAGSLPKVTDLAPGGASDGGLEPATPALDPGQPPINPRARLAIERLMFRRSDWKVDVALRSLEEAKLDDSPGKAMRDSGFHVAELPMDRLALFRANLPAPVSLEVSTIMPMADYSPVTLVSRIGGTRVGRATDSTGQLHNIAMTGGAYRLLARLAADAQGETLVDLVPQHYFEKITVTLRPPGQRVMDGDVFEAMRIRQAIPAGQVWLIWADAPPAEEARTGGAMGNAEGGMETERPAADSQPPLLGTMMLNGLRGQLPVRMVLVVYVRQ